MAAAERHTREEWVRIATIERCAADGHIPNNTIIGDGEPLKTYCCSCGLYTFEPKRTDEVDAATSNAEAAERANDEIRAERPPCIVDAKFANLYALANNGGAAEIVVMCSVHGEITRTYGPRSAAQMAVRHAQEARAASL